MYHGLLYDRAGAVILEHYAGDLEVARKADRSPVTVADEEAERVIPRIRAAIGT